MRHFVRVPVSMCGALACLALVLLLGSGLARRSSAEDAPAPIQRVATGAHFRVLCHFDNQAVADSALEIAEAVWKPTIAVLGRAPELPEKIEINLYRTVAAYKQQEQQLTAGRFARNAAFSSWKTLAAYVALEPAVSDALLAQVGLSAQTRRNVAHEAAHLIVYRTWPTYRRHPAWLSEGIATFAADRALVPGGGTEALAAQPIPSRRMVLFRRQQEQDMLPVLRDVLRADRYRDLGFHARYAFWWGLFRSLYTGPRAAAFRQVLAAIPDMPRGGAFRGALLTAMQAALGGPDGRFEALETALRADAGTMPGDWDEVSRSLTVQGDTWVQLAFAHRTATCWRRRPVGRAHYRITGSVTLPDSPNPEARVLLGRAERAGYLSVELRAGRGITIRRYDAEADRFTELARAATLDFALGRRHRFRIEVQDGRVTVRVNGGKPLSASATGHPLEGPYGVSVPAGGAAIWKGVELR